MLYLDRGAEFEVGRKWRYRLWRKWEPIDHVVSNPFPIDGPLRDRMLVVIGLNPSTADETYNDPTVERCCRRALFAGFDGLIMLNLFAWRSTDPAGMKSAVDPIGPRNTEVLLNETVGRAVLCAWGTHGSFLGRGPEVASLLKDRLLFALAVTKDGHPKHPLYSSYATKPVRWSGYPNA